LAAAQKNGKRVLVHVWASWCPECKAQTPIIQGLLKKPENADVVFLKLDFDKQVAEWKALGARSQSTLIMFKGTKETGRLVGDTRPAAIAAVVASAN
jgi:thiol-disulfide isomerase/thioredoxin